MKIAIVTGAGSGIGKYTALALLREGYTLVLTGRTKAHLEKTRDAAGENIARAYVQEMDVTRPESVQEVFAMIKNQFGRLDLLFNNAGINVPAVSLEDLLIEDWQQVVDTNLTGAFLCIQEAFKLMKTQTPCGGRIINNGSISAHVPRPDAIAYNATKHAVTGLTKSAALDGRKYNIACGQIDIGNAATDMTSRMTTGVKQADGRLGAEPKMNVEDVARAVVYMASLPLDANVQFMTVMATKMPFIGRG